MNISELARVLRINPQELRDLLPQMGFNIGQKAIKIDNNTARRIIREWPTLMKKIRAEQMAGQQTDKIQEDLAKAVKKEVFVPAFIIIKDFSAISQVPVNRILTELMKNGIFASINEKIDFETALIIGGDLGLEVKASEQDEENAAVADKKLEDILGQEDNENLRPRAPIIVIMGHVDHGKTKLLDSIRKTNVMAGEAGGITQHIGAYQVKRKDKTITFIDTPGHEAFTAMRSRGAKVADIAILVVAADDGVKPQTVEAFKIIEAAKIPFIVAINKIDKPEADINRTKQDLSARLNITPEDWGGKTICAPISAKDGTGIEALLDVLLLVADMEADTLRANPAAQAAGTVIEARIDKGAGPIATILVQNGTLRIGDQLCFAGSVYGKVKALDNYKGELIESAGPSTPARILGLKILPEVGDVLEVGEGEKIKAKKVSSSSAFAKASTQIEESDDNVARLNLIIKSDVLGSAEAIEESLMKINTEKIKVKILSKGLGNINEGDIKRAESENAQILGFNVKVQPQVESLLRERGTLKIKFFSIIYDLIKYVKDEMRSLAKPEVVRVDLGRLKILALFRAEDAAQIVGGKVLDGEVRLNSLAEVWRGTDLIGSGKLAKLQAGKQDVSSVEKDQECGIRYEGKPIIEVGDIVKFFIEVERVESL